MAFKSGPDLKAGPFGRKGSLGPKVTTPGQVKPPPPKGPGGVRIEDRIGVQAPAEVVWEIVYDLARWAEWNPTYPRAEGQVRIGGTLSVTLALPGQPKQELRPRVLEWVPNEQLHWRLTMLGGMISTLRYIEIETLTPEAVVVSNGEFFQGLMGPSLGKRMGRAVQRGFRTMNEALKDRAETHWAQRRG